MRVLYIAYWGLLEPLGQSLILPTVLRMARQGTTVHLLTFEKSEDLRERSRVADNRRILAEAGIAWQPARYHRRVSVIATLWDVAVGLTSGLVQARRLRPMVVHGRTPIGALVGWSVARAAGLPFVCHHEGAWADQQVESGVWSSGSLVYRAALCAERMLHTRADGIVVLSEKTIARLRSWRVRDEVPRVVVPSCTDLTRFSPPVSRRRGDLDVVYLGRLGGRYPIAPIAGFIRALRERVPAAHLKIVSPSDHAEVRRSLVQEGLAESSFSLVQVVHDAVPDLLRAASVGLSFVRPGPGAETCSPTKVGEYWACGIPSVSSAGLGDVDAIARRERVGIIVDDFSQEALKRGARALADLLRDPDLGNRCRRAAERHYSLETAVSRQLGLYGRLARSSTR